MKNIISGIVISSCFPSQAIKLFLEFEKAQSQARKLSSEEKMTSEKMTDKIKVWKCEECTAPEPCRKISGSAEVICINRANQKWKLCNKYEITERKPKQDGTPVSQKDLTDMTRANLDILRASIMGYSIEELSKPLIQPPRKRVKNFSDIPPTWLEDVVEEPVSAEKWVNDYDKEFPENRNSNLTKMQIAFKAGEQNQRLRNQPKQTEYHAYSELVMGTGNAEKHEFFKAGWKARGKSHNLDT